MTEDTSFDHRRPHGGHATRHGRPNRRLLRPMVRWSSLATGSLLGIGSWAMAYALGATVWLALGGSMAAPWVRLCMGGYGALSASMALALAAHTAARTGGAHTVENGLLYGLALWSMSTITLVVVATLTTAGVIDAQMVQAAPILAVGLAAIGLLPGGADAVGTTWQAMAAVVATLVLSLLIALWGGLRGRCRDR